MNDQPLWRGLRSWLQDEQVLPPDAEEAARRVAALLPRTRQRRRAWWRPSPAGPRPSSPTQVEGHHQLRPDPEPTANGHPPTVTRRIAIMFSPAKAIIGGALVFVIGGAFLVGQPADPQTGGEPDAATSSGLSEPTPFTAHLVWMGSSDIGNTTYTVLDGHTERRGAVWAPRFTASDPRLEGRLTIRDDEDIYPGQEGTFFAGMMTWRLESDDGAWQGSSPYFLFSDPEWDIAPPDMLFLAGEGAYEGLHAAIVVPDLGPNASNIADLQGVIFPAAPPPAPAAP